MSEIALGEIDAQERAWRERAGQDLGKLAKALAKAQGEMKNAVLNKTNPHFKSKFADLASVREATLPALTKNGLAIVQFTRVHETRFFLHTLLIHESGESLESVYPLPHQLDKPQAVGSALTYARRYSWSSMCGIASDEDDDANVAQNEGAGRKTEPGGRDIMHGVGTGEPAPPTFEIHDQVGDVIDMAQSPEDFLTKVTDLCETSGAYWPNNKDNTEWIGKWATGQNNKKLAAQARSTFKFGRDAFANYEQAKMLPDDQTILDAG